MEIIALAPPQQRPAGPPGVFQQAGPSLALDQPQSALGFRLDNHFRFLKTFSPTCTSSLPGTGALPLVEAIIVVLPELLGPCSWVRSTSISSLLPSTVILTFSIGSVLS